MSRNKKSILHIHASSAGMYTYAAIASVVGCDKIIYHLHSDKAKNVCVLEMIKDSILTYLFQSKPAYRIACSMRAGKDVFRNKPFDVVGNGIDVDRFVYNLDKRKALRDELRINDKFVLGQIGRFSPPKNQIFTLELLKELIDRGHNDIITILIGEGDDQDQLKQFVNENGLEQYVLFFEPLSNIEDMYQCFDLFIFPSLWEGFGIVVLEAQLSGLPVICSENIIDEVILTDYSKKINLVSRKVWIETIEEQKRKLMIGI